VSDTKIVRDDKSSSGPDGKGATEKPSEIQRIETIKGSEVLGYPGGAREEHSGQNPPRKNPDPEGDLADNKPSDTKP
jgi:hypothetical protein